MMQCPAAVPSRAPGVSVTRVSNPQRGIPVLSRTVTCKSAISTDRSLAEEEAVVDFKDLPTVYGLPLIGKSKYLVDKNLDLGELHDQHGSAFRVDMGMFMAGWNLAINDPKAAREILSFDHTRFESKWPEEYTTLMSPWGREASIEELGEWKRMISRVLSRENVLSLQLPLMVEDISKRLRETAESGEQITWTQETRRIAFGVATRAAVGGLMTKEELNGKLELFNQIVLFGLMNFGLKDGLPGTPYHRGLKARRKIEAMLYPKIKAALDDPEMLEGERSGVSRMVAAVHEDKTQYIPTANEPLARYIAAQAFFLMGVGTDTTSIALLRLPILLKRHPEWFQRLKDEQDRLRAEFGDDIDRKVLSRSAVATAFAQEMLRHKIPVPSAFRRAARDITAGGIRIPAGTNVIVNIAQATKDTGPPEFDPGLWLNPEGTAVRGNDATGNLAFGAGPRRCAGASLAVIEIITVIAIFVREIESLEFPPEENDHDYPNTPSHPTGFPIRFTPRTYPAA